VRQAGGDANGQGAVAAVAELGWGDGVFGGEHLRAGGAEHEVPGRGPGDHQGPEPVDHLMLVEGEQPGGGSAGGAERELGDLAGGQHAVLPDHAQQPAVPAGQPSGEGGEQVRGDREPPGAAPAGRLRSAAWERGVRRCGHGDGS